MEAFEIVKELFRIFTNLIFKIVANIIVPHIYMHIPCNPLYVEQTHIIFIIISANDG